VDIKESGLVNTDTNWYYRAKVAAVIRKLKLNPNIGLLVDVGSGSGFFIDPGYSTSPPINLKDSEWFVECPHLSGDVYLFIDVLEHVDEDVNLLQHYVNEASDEALFIVSVPAFSFLWSKHDEFLEHKRRYTRADLEKVATLAGLSVVSSGYLFSSVFPLVYLVRLFNKIVGDKTLSSDMREYPYFVNLSLRLLCRLEHNYFANKRFGTSVILSGKKSC
jgi:hypothetical protein